MVFYSKLENFIKTYIMQEYTNNPFVGNKVIQELKIGTRKNTSYNPFLNQIHLIHQLENMDYLAYEIIERLKDKEPVVRQILKEQNDIDYLMDMHQEYYNNENTRENSLVYKLQNQYLSDIETQRIISNIPLCPGNIIELDTNEHQMLQLSPVMYLISVNWATSNQNIIKEYFHRWVSIVPYNENLYVAMYSPNTSKIQENKTIHQKQFLNVYNHRYVFNYKYAYLLNILPRNKIYLTYNGQLYQLERDDNTDPNALTVNEVGYKVLSKLVKDFTNISTSMLSVEKFHIEVVGGMKKDLEGLFDDKINKERKIDLEKIIQKHDIQVEIDVEEIQNNRMEKFFNDCISIMQGSFNASLVNKFDFENCKYQIINVEEIYQTSFDSVRQFIIQLEEYKQFEVIDDQTDQAQKQLFQQLKHQADKIIQDMIYTVQFDFDIELLDTQKEYFSPNQDYMFSIRQYQFTNQNEDVFRIVAPMNNIFSNVYVYTCADSK